jgi:hypothetical protein
MTGEHEESYRCSAAARWLPWVLAAAIAFACVMAAVRSDPAGVLPRMRLVRGIIVAFGVFAGLRLVVSTRDVGIRVRVRERDLVLERGGRSRLIRYDEILDLDFEAPLRHYRRWLPGLVILDRNRRANGIPALISRGDMFVRSILARSGRRDLEGIAMVLGLEARMGRAHMYVAGGFAAAAVLILGAIVAASR